MNDEEIVGIFFKFPREVADALEAEAKSERRSRTAQIIRILEDRYGLPYKAPETDAEEAERRTA